jgi:hypothetical protein
MFPRAILNLCRPKGPAAAACRFALLAVVSLLFAPAARPETTGAGLAPARAVAHANVLERPDGYLEERLSLEPALVSRLLNVPVGGAILIADWPISPGFRRQVRLVRHDVYAPGARIVKIVPEGEVEVPRSRWLFFWGADDLGSARVAASVDPDTGSLRALMNSEAGGIELTPPASRASAEYRLSRPEIEMSGTLPPWMCGEESLPAAPPPTARTPQAALVLPEATMAPASITKSAVVAIDTDNEYMLNRFGNDTTAATNWIASLFASMNVIYERDVQLDLLEGYTILRVSTVADPYVQTDVPASGNDLNEFSNYWSAHYGDVKRTIAALLSGKETDGGASGIAWLSGLCSSSFGYSYSELFNTAYLFGDTEILAHEIGHNFGSPHTHCYSPPADQCYASEPGCYSGATSCPPAQTINGVSGVTGTLMSYCQLLGCEPILAFHPRTITEYFNSHITAASACIFNVGGSLPPAPTVSSITPSTGVLAGGMGVTISGSNFSGTATVAFVDLTGSVHVSTGTISSGSISATTPAHTAGKVDVVVMNSDFQTGTLAGGFTYAAVPAPSVSSITPHAGLTAGNTAVTITGSNFDSAATVKIAGAPPTSFLYVNSTTITALTAAHAAGAVDVVVQNPDLQTGTLSSGFTYAAPAARTFASAQAGDDANACTLSSPCRGIAQALLFAGAGGEVTVLDSGGYGPFTVGQAMSITASPGVYAGVSASSGDAITVSAGAAASVTIEGLTINGLGGTNGVRFTSGAGLELVRCAVSGFVDGIRMEGGGTLLVRDTEVRTATGAGIRVVPASPGRADLWRVRLEGNGTGLLASGGSSVSLFESVLAANSLNGASCDSGDLTVEDCLVTGNGTGGAGSGTGTLRLSDTTVVDNATGLAQSGGGTILSRSNNTIEGNTSNTSGTVGAFAPH